MTKNVIVEKVRGFYYHTEMGLFLIQTEKSKVDKLWTTPGGRLEKWENRISGLKRLIELETGLVPEKVAENPFYGVRLFTRGDHVSKGKRVIIHTRAYQVDLNIYDGFSNCKYCFVLKDDLSNVRLTPTMRLIVNSLKFERFVNELCDYNLKSHEEVRI